MVAALGTRELARRPQRYARSALLLTLALAIGLLRLGLQPDLARLPARPGRLRSGRGPPGGAQPALGSLPALELPGAYASLDGVSSARSPSTGIRLDLSDSSGTQPCSGSTRIGTAGAVSFRKTLRAALSPRCSPPREAVLGSPRCLFPAGPRSSRSTSTWRSPVCRGTAPSSGPGRPSLSVVDQGRGRPPDACRRPASGCPAREAHRLRPPGRAARPRYPLSLVGVETNVIPSFRVNRPVSVDVTR